MVVAMILGPMFEAQLRRSLSIAEGDPMTLLQSPFAVFVYASLALIFVASRWLKRREQQAGEVLERLDDDPDRVPVAERSGRS
jgi:putative tricarboxylic transport membrane protein